MATHDWTGLDSDGAIIQRREEERDETRQRQQKHRSEINTVVKAPKDKYGSPLGVVE